MRHYFVEQEHFVKVKQDLVFEGTKYEFITAKGIFASNEVDSGSLILAKTACRFIGEGDEVLDLGCGNGIVGLLTAFHAGANVTFCDINPTAIKACRMNLELYKRKFDTIVSDGFDKINKQFDFILFNPPIRAGKKVYYPLLEQAKQYLKKDGQLIVIIRKSLGAPSATKLLHELYSQVDILEKDRGYHVICASKDLVSKEEK